MRFKAILPIIFFVGIIVSCSIPFKIQSYRYVAHVDCDHCENKEFIKLLEEKILNQGFTDKYIQIRSDSILVQSIVFGGITTSIQIKYFRSNDTISILDQNPVGPSLLYSKDSLIEYKTKDKYYNVKYLEKVRRKQKREL